ncbi:MAG TPA: 1,3-beta-glucanase, partial [Streptomyces sp.]|nr:1,3-beta-glucanase [Streptomyces sp.]
MDSPRLSRRSRRLFLSLASVLALTSLTTGLEQGAPAPAAEAPARTAA